LGLQVALFDPAPTSGQRVLGGFIAASELKQMDIQFQMKMREGVPYVSGQLPPIAWNRFA
jgi:hypothetical protein